MAKQTGIIKLKGTIGDISFYKTKDGYLARGKGGVEKDRIENDPAFQRTRENGSEFGRAGNAGRVVRTAFKMLLRNTSDNRITSRLTGEMLKVIQADSTNVRGERNVLNGDLKLLEGFEFNVNGALGSTLYAGYTTNINRETGEAVVAIQEFVPQDNVVGPEGATHFALISGGAEINFEEESFNLATAKSEQIEIGPQSQAALNLTNALTAGSTLPIFLLLGIEFYQEVNGMYYPLKSGSYNALTLIAVNLPD
jgi:hypothetical protein